MIHGAGVAGGALEQEYRAGREAAGLVALARGTLNVSGPKRQDFLHAMLSNDVAGRRPGEGCRAASMTAKGSLQAFVRVLVDASVVVLVTQERVEPLLRTLEYYKVGAPGPLRDPAGDRARPAGAPPVRGADGGGGSTVPARS